MYYNLNITIIATKVDKIGKTLREKQEKLIKDTLGITENDNFILCAVFDGCSSGIDSHYKNRFKKAHGFRRGMNWNL